jgi:hypothetical protein
LKIFDDETAELQRHLHVYLQLQFPFLFNTKRSQKKLTVQFVCRVQSLLHSHIATFLYNIQLFSVLMENSAVQRSSFSESIGYIGRIVPDLVESSFSR